MHYYAARNRYGSETSVGFENQWYVMVFEDRASRDKYLKEEQDRLDVRAIKRKEIHKYVRRAARFSNERRMIDTNGADYGDYWGIGIQGLVGFVEVSDGGYGLIEL